MIIKSYVKTGGRNPFKRWFYSLDETAAAKVAMALAKIAAGNLSNMKWFRGIGEYRINWGPGYRIYLVRENDMIVLLYGGTKKNQKRDIINAISLYHEYKLTVRTENE